VVLGGAVVEAHELAGIHQQYGNTESHTLLLFNNKGVPGMMPGTPLLLKSNKVCDSVLPYC